MSQSIEYPCFLDIQAEGAVNVSILPVPYDGTSTWKKGADRGPFALLEASSQLELYDIPTATEPYRQGIETLPPVLCHESPEMLAQHVHEQVTAILEAGRLPVGLGGDHSVSIGAIQAAAAAVPTFSVLQVDAHLDSRESYQGSAYNHACVMARARELADIVQVGIRSADAAEIPSLDPKRVFWAHRILERPTSEWVEEAVSLLSESVWVSIDLDGLDPAILPATGTPVPGGLHWHHLQALLARISDARRVIGFDVVELCPHPAHWGSDFLAAQLVYRFLAEILRPRESEPRV